MTDFELPFDRTPDLPVPSTRGARVASLPGRQRRPGADIGWRTAGLLCLLAIGACSDRADRADGTNPSAGQQLDSAISQTREVAGKAADKAAELADKARDNTKAYLDSPGVKQNVEQAKDAIGDAGRVIKEETKDSAITSSIVVAFARDNELSIRRTEVHTEDGQVRLSGSVPSQAAKDRAESIAKATSGVTTVDNQMVVATTATQ